MTGTDTQTTRTILGLRTAFALLASAGLTLLASSSAPTPLYATYQAMWGFSDLTVTVIFGVYALAVLVSLMVFGSLSDHVVRRPLRIVGLGAQALVTALAALTAAGLLWSLRRESRDRRVVCAAVGSVTLELR